MHWAVHREEALSIWRAVRSTSNCMGTRGSWLSGMLLWQSCFDCGLRSRCRILTQMRELLWAETHSRLLCERPVLCMLVKWKDVKCFVVAFLLQSTALASCNVSLALNLRYVAKTRNQSVTQLLSDCSKLTLLKCSHLCGFLDYQVWNSLEKKNSYGCCFANSSSFQMVNMLVDVNEKPSGV